MSDAAFLDYQLLYNKAAEWQRVSARQTATTASNSSSDTYTQLQWMKYDIALIRVQHASSSSPSPPVHAMLQSMAASQKEARELTPPAGTAPLQVTGAIARMHSPFIIELPCVGRYTHDSLSLHAAATLQQRDEQQQQQYSGDSSESSGSGGELTMVEVSIELVRQSTTESGRASTWTGQYMVREYDVNSSREKGSLKLTHLFHLQLNTTVAESGQ